MEVLALSLQTVDGWIAAGGYAVLFGLLFACGLGLPLPEDIPLLIAGALIAQGRMDLLPACAFAWCGIIGGDIMLYHIAKKFGMEVTRIRFIGKHVTAERIKRLEGMFEKYGIFVVGIGRMFAGVRGAMVVAAGVTRYNFWKFFITDGIAAVVSGGFFVLIGHLLGANLSAESVKEYKNYFIVGAVVLAVIGLGWILWRRSRAEERVEKVAGKAEHLAEAAHLKHPPASHEKA
jgi:membrane protein DedA with SNARE-associated domain